jgi:hypothetical protein
VQPAERPGDPNAEPIFRHVDDPDVPWQKVRAQRNADGSVAYIREKWLAFSPDPQYLSLYARHDPGMINRKHGHYSPNVIFVIEGDLWCGDRYCPAGTHIELPLGASFGPMIAGPGGCTLFEVMLGDPRGWGDDPESYERAIAERGVTPLPDPPIDLPEWIEDLRDGWAGRAHRHSTTPASDPS